MSDAAARIKTLLTERIVVIDGAMGTMLQGYELDEAGFRGKELADHPRDLKGDNDLLNLTRPGIVEEIHGQYLEAGADILETNTFNSTAVAQADYGLQGRAYDLNVAGALVARRAVLAAMCAGVVPQHPPTTFTQPLAAKPWRSRAMISGVSSKPPKAFGSPAFG